jgi:hypothetical protein
MHPRQLLISVAAVVALSGCARMEVAAASAAVPIPEAYPDDIRPPAGTQYPCALTALPRTLPGIPEEDRSYINRTYARVLRATQAKLLVLKALHDERNIAQANDRYQSTTTEIVKILRRDAVPSGLEPFRDNLVTALELQQTFFRKGAEMRHSGQGMDAVYALPEGRQASSLLISAWGKMQSRYPSWNAETSGSIFHHLCALDLF